MKLVSLTLLWLIPLTLLQAQDVFNHPLTPKTKPLFEQTSNNLAQHPIVKGNFNQEKVMKSLGRTLKSNGNFTLIADVGMVWQTLQPFPSTLALGSTKMVQVINGQKSIIDAKGNPTFTRLAQVISAIFSGNSRILLDNFDVYYLQTDNNWQIGLKAHDKNLASFAHQIILQGDKSLRSILINEASGDSISYLLSNPSYPTEVKEELELFKD